MATTPASTPSAEPTGAVVEAASTLSIVARDVKIQMIQPAVVSEYRLIGYENRALAREGFPPTTRSTRARSTPAAGHRAVRTEPGRTSPACSASPTRDRHRSLAINDELGMLRLRLASSRPAAPRQIEVAVKREQIRSAAAASTDLRFTAAVAAFGQHLRGGKYLGSFGPEQIERLALPGRAADRFGYRGEFLRLVKLAGALRTQPSRGCSTARGDGQCASERAGRHMRCGRGAAGGAGALILPAMVPPAPSL